MTKRNISQEDLRAILTAVGTRLDKFKLSMLYFYAERGSMNSARMPTLALPRRRLRANTSF